jgi:hypothetical protein
MSSGTKGQLRKIAREGVEVDFLAAFKRLLPNLYGMTLGQAVMRAYRVNLYQRDDHTWLAVVSSYMPDDGRPVVAFGNGIDVNRALVSVDKSIAGRKWKEDRRTGGSVQVGVHLPQSGGLGVNMPKQDEPKFVQTAHGPQLKLL